MQPEITIPSEAKALMQDAEKTLQLVRDYQIQTAADYEGAAEQLKAIKSKAKSLDEQRKAITKPLDDAKQQVMNLFRPPLQFLADAESLIKRGMADFQREQERLRLEAQRKAEEQARKEQERLARRAKQAAEKGQADKAEQLAMQAQMVQAPVVAFEKPKAAGVSVRKNWKADVVDFDALVKAVAAGKAPARLLMVNTTELNKIAKALQADTDIPGVRVYAEDVVAARAI